MREPTQFGWWLQAALDARRLSQAELAEMTKISQPTFSRWIWRDVLPEPAKLEQLAAALELDEEERDRMFRLAGHGGVAAASRSGDGDPGVPMDEELVRLRRMLLPSSPLSDQDRADLRSLLNAVMAKWEPLMVGKRRRSA